MAAKGQWAVAAEFATLQEAFITKGMLEDNGVPVVVENGTIGSVYPMTMTWAPIKLLVPAASLEKARELMEGDGDVS